MQTVNFNCPHCGNLMAVGLNLLGKNVRCPHCKMVVQAPIAPGEPMSAPTVSVTAPLPQFNVPKPGEQESIFSERHDEDLFGSEPLKPKLPDQPVTPPVPKPNNQAAPVLSSQGPGKTDFVGELQFEVEDNQEIGRRERPERETRAVEIEGSRRGVLKPENPTSGGTGIFTWMLLAYAVLITIAASYLAYQSFSGSSSKDHPFKAIPDVYGEYEKANRKQVSLQSWMPKPTAPVPNDLKVRLGEELTVGDISIKPKAIENKKFSVTSLYHTKEDMTRDIKDILTLTLTIKNNSADTWFHPNDPAFNRYIKNVDSPTCYTALQIGTNYFGGMFDWPLSGDDKGYIINGFEEPKTPLGPGQERDTIITISQRHDIFNVLRKEPKDRDLLWRVQLRRGLVPYSDASGQTVDISSTCVIGVTFKTTDIK